MTDPVLVHEFLSRTAQRVPERPAIIEGAVTTTYAALDGRANQVANLLHAQGVRRGDRVVLALDNCVDLVALYFGVMRAGAVAVPLPPGPRSDRLAGAIEDCSPRAIVVDRADWDAQLAALIGNVPVRYLLERRAVPRPPDGMPRFQPLRAALEAVSSEDPGVRAVDIDLAAIIYTSGTTGRPRGVMLTHLNIRANTESIITYLRLTEADRVMCVLPLYYVYGLSLLHTHMRVGGSLVIDNRFTFPNMVLDGMRQHEVTGFAGVPSTFALLLHRSNLPNMEFPSLRYITQAGGAMPPARVAEWLKRGPRAPFYVMYGATEASARLTYLDPNLLPAKLGSIGRAIPGVEIRVEREDGSTASPGEVGELVARGSNIAGGYWNAQAETQERFGPSGYRTGDLGYKDDDGFLYLVGRRHDMIKVGAHRVGSKEIEDVLHENELVLEAAVLAEPHEILGEVPVAFVALRTPRDAVAELGYFCAQRLAPHKVPSRFILCDELPKMATGKIDRQSLLRRLGTSTAASH